MKQQKKVYNKQLKWHLDVLRAGFKWAEQACPHGFSPVAYSHALRIFRTETKNA